MTQCDVAIIGAGPYGLSIAAHLNACGIDCRILGSPMHTWLTEMPRGMRLKSEGFASSLYDPKSEFTLDCYCREQNIPYADQGHPVALETFSSYGLEFQKRYVPQVEQKQVTLLQRTAAGFEVSLADGEVFTARRVVVAVGLTHFPYVPPLLASLPTEFVTHSSRHRDVSQFKGHTVAILGAGASALDLAALLHHAGASVEVIARSRSIRFHDRAPVPRPLSDRLRAPTTGLGPGWDLLFYANAPLAFHYLPQQFRLDAVRRSLGPAPGWFIKDEVVGKVPFHLGSNITQADVQNTRVRLEVTDDADKRQAVVADHVISATGYRVDLQRLAFLQCQTREAVHSVEQTPVLSSNFESSVPGLYFVGPTAANSFGPVMRFAYGAGFTSRRLAKHLARTASPASVWVRSREKVAAEARGEVVCR